MSRRKGGWYPTSVLDEAQIRDAARILEERFGLDTLWLFGSAASGAARPDSDLDIAVLLRSRPSVQDLLAARESLGSALGRDVDLVDLEQASPILAMQVIRHGSILHESAPGHRVLFAAGLVARYEDLRLLRAPIEEAALRRVRGRA